MFPQTRLVTRPRPTLSIYKKPPRDAESRIRNHHRTHTHTHTLFPSPVCSTRTHGTRDAHPRNPSFALKRSFVVMKQTTRAPSSVDKNASTIQSRRARRDTHRRGRTRSRERRIPVGSFGSRWHPRCASEDARRRRDERGVVVVPLAACGRRRVRDRRRCAEGNRRRRTTDGVEDVRSAGRACA